MNPWLQFGMSGSWGVLFLMLLTRFTNSNWGNVQLRKLPEAIRRRSADDPELWVWSAQLAHRRDEL